MRFLRLLLCWTAPCLFLCRMLAFSKPFPSLPPPPLGALWAVISFLFFSQPLLSRLSKWRIGARSITLKKHIVVQASARAQTTCPARLGD